MTLPHKPNNTDTRVGSNKGFTLIELMVVVAIVSILAVIALPAYLNYVTRSKVSEAMVFAAEAKTAVSEGFYSTRTIPPSNELAGLPYATSYNKHDYISKLEIMSVNPAPGTVEVTIKIPGSKADGQVLQLIPSTANPVMVWICTSPDDGRGVPLNQAPANCRG
jgi:type IV pilus assembly protein PilA